MKILLKALGCVLLLATASAQERNSIHFIPGDHALGDVHPFIKDGQCYLYYLKPGKYEAALAHSSDWHRWAEMPLAHRKEAEDAWKAPYYVLGVFKDPVANVFRSFYGHVKGRMVSSVSTDLINWSCGPKEMHLPAGDYYERRRDPYVFWIPEWNQYGCVMTTWMKGQPRETGGAVSLATSPDLMIWTDHGPILYPGNMGEPECPQLFKLEGRWYLLASIYDRAVGGPVYWSAQSPKGPWKTDERRQLDGKDLCAAQVAMENEKPVLLGWIPLKPALPGRQNWGGHFALPREIHVQKNGYLGIKLFSALLKDYEALSYKNFDEFVLVNQSKVVEKGWQKLVLEFELLWSNDDAVLDIIIPPLAEILVGKDSLEITDSDGVCWSSTPVELEVGKPVKVQVFVEEDMVEVFLDEQYSLASRVPLRDGKLAVGFRSKGETKLTTIRAAEWIMPGVSD